GPGLRRCYGNRPCEPGPLPHLAYTEVRSTGAARVPSRSRVHPAPIDKRSRIQSIHCSLERANPSRASDSYLLAMSEKRSPDQDQDAHACAPSLRPPLANATPEFNLSRYTHTHTPTQILSPELAAALSAGPQLRATSWAALRLYGVLAVSFMGSLSFGFDSSVVSSVNGLIQFTEYFGLEGGDIGGGQGIITAMLYSIFSLGCIAGCSVAAPVADRWGRRRGMLVASAIILIGVAVVTAAQSRAYLFVGRFFIGFGSSLNNAAAPAYVAEMSPPQWRGRLAGIYNTFTFVGSLTCSGLVIGTGRISSSLSWRLPFAIQLVPTLILLVGVFFIPESPRWLMSVGRPGEARSVLAKYHAAGDSDAPLVVLEFRELEQCIGPDRAGAHRWWDYSGLVNSWGARYRTLLTSYLALCCLLSGTGIFYFVTVAFDLAGVATQNARLVFSFISIAVGAAGALSGALIADRVGRRALWLGGSTACTVVLVLTAGPSPRRWRTRS
ncbi:unnamed protein product, partial [Mycena citricolor]